MHPRQQSHKWPWPWPTELPSDRDYLHNDSNQCTKFEVFGVVLQLYVAQVWGITTYRQTKLHVQNNFQRGHRKGEEKHLTSEEDFVLCDTLYSLTSFSVTLMELWLTVWLAIVDSRKMDIIRPAASVNLRTNSIKHVTHVAIVDSRHNKTCYTCSYNWF